jgi:acyl-CoA thioesterase-1
MNRWVANFALSCCLFLAACGGDTTRNSEPTRPAPAAAIEPTKSLPKIVAFGDSLTAGHGLARSASYPALLQKKLDDAGYQFEVVNAGISGDTSAGGLRRIDWALEGGVKVLILELGANDILRGQPVNQMKINLRQTIEKAKAKGVSVLLAGMEAPTDTGAEYRRAVHEAFPELAREFNIPLIPFFLAGVAGIDSLNQADGIHPNERGTEMIAATVYQALLPLLGAPTAAPAGQ